jgi:Na+/melibiose symporter-like transporter
MGVNIRIVALIFLPLVLTMLIPFFLLKEKKEENKDSEPVKHVTVKEAFNCSFKNPAFIYWMFTAFVMTIGTQLFLGGINELFSSIGLNMTIVMASSFVPVPFTIILYNKIVKNKGLGFGYRYILLIFTIGMLIMFFCNRFYEIYKMEITPEKMETILTMVAILGGLFVSFSIGAFFSVTYTVPSHLAAVEMKRSGKTVASMYFAVQGIFEGVASGIASGFILVNLKHYDVIHLLPIVVALTSMIAFFMSFKFIWLLFVLIKSFL